MDEKILEQHFEWDKMFDERYHCKYCSYDTQLPNKAVNHFVKRHEGQVKAKAKKSRAKAKEQDQTKSELDKES